MLILGIESATSQVGVAIGGHEGVLASAHSARDRRHAESIAPQIKFVCEQARVNIEEIGVVAVDIGPGLFTGLRVGIASAMAVAHGLGVPMIGVSSLDLGAFALEHSRRLIVPCYDARRGEVFTANYRSVPGGVQRITEPTVATPDELAAELMAAGEDILMLGDGSERYREQFESISHVEFAGTSMQFPSARSLVELAHPKAMREEFVSPNEIEPLYIRLPDAEINWKTRDSG
ncbi:MAG: tRNA threonylcarbamoyladenosine biosynthesis protein TsaB [Verrucomicrobiales bacterium]|jgi:tRNA threonylcarbamoyladenosine biosynthesis protein TsaB